MRVCAHTWPFTFGVRLGGMTTSIANPSLARSRGRVYLLRGNAAIFSRGFGRVCDRLRAEGVWAEDLRCVGDRWVRQHLRADWSAGRGGHPVVLVGHSCGGRYALFTAQQLCQQGIPIELLVCIDVAIPYPVPANVRQAVNVYRSQWRIYPARPLSRAADSAALIDNIDLDAADSPVPSRGLHHLNITASPAVQDCVVARVLQAVRDAERRVA